MSNKPLFSPFSLLFFTSTTIISTFIGITVVLHDRNNYLINYQDKQIALQVDEKTLKLKEEIINLKLENKKLQKDLDYRETQNINDLDNQQKEHEQEIEKIKLDHKEAIRAKNRHINDLTENNSDILSKWLEEKLERTKTQELLNEFITSNKSKDEIITFLEKSIVDKHRENKQLRDWISKDNYKITVRPT